MTEYYAPPVTNASKEQIAQVVDLFRDSEVFGMLVRGIGAGLEGIVYGDTHFDPHRRNISPLSTVVEMPAWEGSHRGRKLEHDFVYSIGVIIGAFCERGGISVDGAIVI